LSSELEICLNDAFQTAREARHEFMTVEHLLLAIIDAPKVREILRACGADAVRLRKELAEFIDQTTPRLKQDDDREVQPTLGFQRVLQRAVFHVQSSGKNQREALARRLPAHPAGRVPTRRGQLHFARARQVGRRAGATSGRGRAAGRRARR